MSSIADSLPAIYTRLFPDLAKTTAPNEDKATCMNCPMIKPDAVLGGEPRFNPDTKCCTYHPRMPNFLVGALFDNTDPQFDEGRERVRRKIAGRIGVTPWWLQPPALHEHLYKQVKPAFGRAKSLGCPLFSKDIGGCTVWKFREVVCSTWFCKYTTGADGRKFWMSLKHFLSLVEKQLSRYAMMQINPSYVLDDVDFAFYAREHLTTEDIEGQAPSKEFYANLWREYVGDEEAYYKKCYEIVKGLGPEDMPEILGLDGKVRWMDLLGKRETALEPTLPDKPTLNPDATIKWLDDDTIALAGYSEYDAIALPGAAYTLLKDLRGEEDLATVRKRWHDKYETDLSDEILTTLHHQRVII